MTPQENDDAGPIEDPLSGELIPATQDAELERQGREIVEHDEPGTDHASVPGMQSASLVAGREFAAALDRHHTPQWYARTMADVRPGDEIKPTGTAATQRRKVTARCWPPTDDTRGRGSWHVIEGKGGHWDDHVIQPGECCVHLDGAGHRRVRPTFAVEILLAPSEVQAIELLGGWDNRERMITE